MSKMDPVLLSSMCFVCMIVLMSIFGALYYAYTISTTQTALNTQAASGLLGYATPEVYGLCPTSPTMWTRQPFTDKVYCVDPTAIGITDKFGNLVGAVKGATCPDPYKVQTINGRTFCVNDNI